MYIFPTLFFQIHFSADKMKPWMYRRYVRRFFDLFLGYFININLIVWLSGWLSPALPVLMSENTPLLSGPLSNEELSWISR